MMYWVEHSKEGWKVKHDERLICCVPSENEARTVARILQQDQDHHEVESEAFAHA